MERYMPPFTITNQMLMLVAEIAEKTGNISNFHSFETKPHLRRNNRIRSIHSSLAIEANSLSLDEVRSVISGKTVIGPRRKSRRSKTPTGPMSKSDDLIRILWMTKKGCMES